VDEIASISIDAKLLVFEATTLLGFILGIELMILSQLMRAMCEFTLLLIRAISIFHKPFA